MNIKLFLIGKKYFRNIYLIFHNEKTFNNTKTVTDIK